MEEMDELDFLTNASASFTDIEQNGPPIMPLPFDQPQVGRAVRVDAPVYNPQTQDIMKVSNIIYEHHMDGRPPERAYWVGRKLKKCIFGVVKECTILRFRNDPEIPWEVTEHKAAGKIMSWQKIKNLQHIEDPQKEVAAMQCVSRGGGHPHVMGALDVLQDEEYLLLFMPFCTSGDLFGFVQQAGRKWHKINFPKTENTYKFPKGYLTIIFVFACSFFFQNKQVFRNPWHDIGSTKYWMVFRTCKRWVYVTETCRWKIFSWTSIRDQW